MSPDILQQIFHRLDVLDELKADVNGLKADINGLKADVSGLKADMREVKTTLGEHSALHREHEANFKIILTYLAAQEGELTRLAAASHTH